jgi:hypothetical protein
MQSVLDPPPDDVERPAEHLEPPLVQSAASLVGGIVGDLKSLIEQQLQLTRMQIEAELRQRVVAMAVLMAGVVMLFVATVFVCLSVSHLLHWIGSPVGTDPAKSPLWMCHGVVAVLLGLIGGPIAWIGRRRFRSVVPFQNPVSELFQKKP